MSGFWQTLLRSIGVGVVGWLLLTHILRGRICLLPASRTLTKSNARESCNSSCMARRHPEHHSLRSRLPQQNMSACARRMVVVDRVVWRMLLLGQRPRRPTMTSICYKEPVCQCAGD